MADKAQIGVTGLAVMGQNLARNIAHKGFTVAVHNRSTEKTDALLRDHGSEGAFIGSHDLPAFVSSLQSPRVLIMMVKAGAPVDELIDHLKPLLDKGDVIIDGGNSLFKDTQRRQKALEADGILYMGSGISGGEEGALNGPAIMPGGPKEAYDLVAPILKKISAHVDGDPCCAYIGADGAGHFVKMVHNGIEYADMQLIAEAYDLLKSCAGLSNEELHATFGEWNQGDLDSFLIQITTQILGTRDPDSEGFLVDKILDQASQKGTGKWTSQSALDLGVPVTAITEAVFARCLSSQKPERVAAAGRLPGPAASGAGLSGDARKQFVNDVRDALYASKVVAYAQGFAQMRAAAQEYGWDLHMGEISSLWRGGCIIRARFLNRIREAYEENPALDNLLLAPYFTAAVEKAQKGWRRVVSDAINSGVPIPALASSLAYYDGYRRAWLPANLIQAQRDLFGAHTFERIDKPGTFHHLW